jgi:uncharacterized protein (DUF58 family)
VSKTTLARLVPEWRIRITNFGLGYVLLTLIVAIAATNTGNNGLYSVLSGLLALLVVSGVVSRRNIRAIECRIEPAGELFAGKPGHLELSFRNRARRVTAQGVFFLHEALPAPLYLPPLSPGQEHHVLTEAVFPRRGVFRDADAGLMTRFPIGLFRKYAAPIFPRETVVYPNPMRAQVPGFPPERGGEARATPRRGFGPDFRTLREFVPGDDPRDLHWKVSARMSRWIVRERQAEEGQAIVFVVDNAARDVLAPAAHDRLEITISRTAGEALALLAQGVEVGLAARGLRLPPAAGPGQRRAILDSLARLELVPEAGAPAIPPPSRGERRREVAA